MLFLVFVLLFARVRLVGLLMVGAGLVWAGKDEQKLILQIDSSGHGSIINDIVFTPDGKYLVSTSGNSAIAHRESGEIEHQYEFFS